VTAADHLSGQFKKLYHGTDAPTAGVIHEKGIEAGPDPEGKHPVFLTNNFKIASKYAERKSKTTNAPPAVVEVHVPHDRLTEEPKFLDPTSAKLEDTAGKRGRKVYRHAGRVSPDNVVATHLT
jgi:hypothetical protein